MAMNQLRSQLRNPDKMQQEKCAISCRVAPSFLRVGHVEIHGRRARRGGQSLLEPLELMVKHLLFREYADIDDPSAELQPRILRMMSEVAKRFSKLMADWLRVGYCQGNFNSDNCLVGGRTMDYGPFGFVQKYDPLWNMWTGGGEHFAFMNQPKAAKMNFASLVKNLVPLLDSAGVDQAQAIVNSFDEVCQEICGDMWRRKLGLSSWDSGDKEIFNELEKLMGESNVDYTIFWRQLAELPATGLDVDSPGSELLAPLLPAFYVGLTAALRSRWEQWLAKWLGQLKVAGLPGEEVAKSMRQTSPKYVPREWMLVEAYDAASLGDYSKVQELLALFSKPFDEQPEMESKYYRKTPPASLNQPGTAFMS